MAPALKLVYFGFPGKAESVRLTAYIGGVEFEDSHIDFPSWGKLKAEVAPQQLPHLYVDGKRFGQSAAQLRYVGALAGLYPTDSLEALSVDEFVDYASEVFPSIGKSMAMPDGDEKLKFRAAMVSEGGDVHKWVAFLDKRLEGKKYAVGDSITIADVQLFCTLGLFRSGIMDGVPKDCFDGFKNIMAHRDLIASHEKVKAKYADATAPGYMVYQ